MSRATEALAGLTATSRWQEDLYRALHATPELPFEEEATRAEVRARLTGWGYEVQEIGGGVVGTLRNGDGPTVLFRADMDALPVTEDSGLDYASTVPGVMHACGHDVHVTCALGAAELLAASRASWSGTYVALFQAAEEIGRGAQAMVDDGLVTKVARPDVCLAQHVLAEPEAGHVGVMPGPLMLASDSLRVTVHGVGSHGSMPHLGVDPIVVAAAIVTRLQTIVSRDVRPGRFAVVTVGSIHAGSRANIIPNHAELLVSVRTYTDDVRDTVLAAVHRIVRAECAAAGCPQEPDIVHEDCFPPTDNDPAVTERVTRAFVEHFGAGRVHTVEPVAASEDFSVIPRAFGVPYTYWCNGAFTPGMTVVHNHNPGFAPAVQPTLSTGTEAAVVAALAYLGG